MGKLIDRCGHRYGRLLVVQRDAKAGPATAGARTRWLCKCDCGGSIVASGHELAAGDTASCGCARRENTGKLQRTHGLTRTATYRSWQAAKERCHNPRSEGFHRYGAKGISMCAEWRESFDMFLADMGLRPSGTSIDRIDNSRGYEPGNCRWASLRDQATNKSNARLYAWRGKEMTSTEIAAAEGIPASSLRNQLKHRIPIDEAVAYVKTHGR